MIKNRKIGYFLLWLLLVITDIGLMWIFGMIDNVNILWLAANLIGTAIYVYFINRIVSKSIQKQSTEEKNQPP